MTNTLSEAIAWAEGHSTHSGGNWDGWCEAFVHNAGGFTNNFESAHLAYRASRVYTPNELSIGNVPNGWLLWWDYVDGGGNNYGHVGFATAGGNALMASSFVTNEIHSNLGYVGRAHYQSVTGHRYLGASPDHGGQYLSGVPHTPPGTVKKPGRTLYTLSTGIPNLAFWKRLQWYAHLNGYTGPIDGVMGVRSWAGVQTGLRHYGYLGKIDGAPGPLTYKALQQMAHKYGSGDAIDGTLSKADYRAIAKRLNLL